MSAVVEVPPAEDAAPDTIVRTLKFEVVWPGWRTTDKHALWRDLWSAMDDLRAAANRGISALFMLKLGLLPWPVEEPKRPKPGASMEARKVPIRTLCYRAMNGGWQPFGTPMYQPREGAPAVSSSVLLDLAGYLYTRLQTDWVDIQHGDRALPTFRSIPIGSPYVEVDKELGTVTFSLWAGRGRRITVRPRRLDSRSWRTLRSATKFGGARLVWDRPPGRAGKWFLSLSVEVPKVDRTSAALICAVRLGMETTCTLAYAERDTGAPVRAGDQINLPASAWQAVRRVARERTARGEWNRKERGLREGRGRARKLRAVEGLGDEVARVTDTAVRQVAAAVVRTAISRGASVLALPDLAHWSVASELDRSEDMPDGDRQARRRWYFSFHQGALRQRIRQAAEREGLLVIEVNPARAGVTCSSCGHENAANRAARRWACSCGCKLSAEVNTARVLVARAAAHSEVARAR